MKEKKINYKYILTRIGIYLGILILAVLLFFISMDYMNVRVLLKDSFLKRASVVIKGDDVSDLTQVFSKTFLENDRLLESTQYDEYVVRNFTYSMDIPLVIILPFQQSVEITVTERVPYIDGELPNESSSDKSKTPPEWQDGRYKITVHRNGASWKITKMETVELLDKQEIITAATPTQEEKSE